MKKLIILAWRNLSRNRRRTFITGGSIFFAIFFALIMRGFQLGSYGNMINNVVENFSGYIQVHGYDFWEEKTINHTFEYTDELQEKINAVENVKISVPKLESFALASSENQTKGALVSGIDPETEDRMTKLSSKIIRYRLNDSIYNVLEQKGLSKESIDNLKNYRKQAYTSEENIDKAFEKFLTEDEVQNFAQTIKELTAFPGQYLNAGEPGVLIGNRLAKYLRVAPGDTIVLLGQGYHGVSAAGKYPVKGIIHIPNPKLDNKLVYMPLKQCQALYSANNRLTSLSINLHNTEKLDETNNEIIASLDTTQYEVMTWKEMNKELVQQIESDNGSGVIMLFILYMVIGFGVLGTVLMMTAERRKEFGVMIAVGMKKYKIVITVFLELVFLALWGIVAGILGSMPLIRYFVVNPIEMEGEMAQMMEGLGVEPIMPFAWQIDYFLNQAGAVSIIVLLAIIYPLFTIKKLKVMKALRS